jgi:tetratricopeptide (TPR) repeat protein
MPKRVSWVGSGLLALVLLLPAGRSLAQAPPAGSPPPPAPSPAAAASPPAPAASPASASSPAETLITRGNAAYRAKDYRAALQLYQEAHLLERSSLTVFNLAQCHRQLGDVTRAIELYQEYLRDWPGSPKHEAAERFIRELKAQRASLLPAPPAPDAPAVAAGTAAVTASTSSATTARPWYRRWYVWTAIGVAVAGGAVAGALVATRPGASAEVGGVHVLPPTTFHFTPGGR